MDRPYTAQQVDDFERDTAMIARRLHDPWGGIRPWARMDPEVLDAMLYDAMVALAETMLEEGD